MTSPRCLVVTGAAGEIGTAIRPFLAERVPCVRLVDLRPIAEQRSNEEAIVGDLHDASVRCNALRGADAVIHLAGIKSDAPWASLLRANIELVGALCTAADAEGVRRIALASTMHVMGLYRRVERILPDMPPRPDSPYATSKVTMESVGQWHALRTSARVCSVRIGCYSPAREHAEPCAWIGGEDLARLFYHVLYHPRGHAPVIHAVAPYRGDDCGQRRLRWRHGFTFAARGGNRHQDLAHIARWYPEDQIAREYRGGVFASGTLQPVVP